MSFDFDLRLLVTGGLAMTRVSTFVMAVPILGIRNVPPMVKIALSAWLAIAAASLLPPTSLPLEPGPVALALSVESLIGVVLAFSVVLFFAAIQYAGQIIGVQIGFAMVNVIDPQSQTNVSIISQVYNLVAVLTFLALDGPRILIRAIQESFVAIPPGVAEVSQVGLFELGQSAATIFSLGFKIALPVVITLLLVSLSMGILGRTVPQLNILVVGFPIKILVGLFMIGACIPFYGEWLVDAIATVPDRMAEAGLVFAGGR